MEEFQGNEAVEFRIFSLIDNTHPPATQLFDDSVM
jgi:hypothetical protein